MINLSETSSTKSRVLSDDELTLVVGGNGHSRHWQPQRHSGNQNKNGKRNNGGGFSGDVIIVQVFGDGNDVFINGRGQQNNLQ